MAVDRDAFLELAESSGPITARGSQDGQFYLVVGNDTLAGPEGPRPYPSLNHIADWLQRNGIQHFAVDLAVWRKDSHPSHAA
jgi:hypothetical protein